MCDSLQELSELSLDLQDRNIDLYKAHNKIVCLVNVFKLRRKIPGPFYRESLEAAGTLRGKRGEMTGVGEMTRFLVFIVTARGSNGGRHSVNREGEGTC
jgi:hypothetical protein